MMKSEINSGVAILFAVIVLVAFSNPCLGTDFVVANADDIETAMETAQPGDTLVMNDGTWNNAEIDFVGNGTAASPITLRPQTCLLYTSPSPRDRQKSRMPSSA